MKLAINAIMTRPGGALTVLLGLLKAWQRGGCAFDVTILASAPATLAAFQHAGLTYPIEAVLAGQSALRRALWQQAGLGRWLAKNRVDVLLTNNHYLSAIPCPQVVHHHNLWRFLTADLGLPRSRRLVDRLRDWSARRALRHAAANIFVSEFLRRQAERCAGGSAGRSQVIPNCLDDELVDWTAGSTAPPVCGRLLAVQNANPHKDNATLLQALAALTRQAADVDWRLHVAGSAGRVDWLPHQRLAGELGIRQRVEWLGFVDASKLTDLHRQSLCLVSTSRLESSGLTLIEAMAAGCPVVASRIPAFVEYADQAALLVEPGNPSQFAAAVLKLHRNQALREQLIALGRRRAQDYRWSIWAPRFAQVIAGAA